MSLITPFAASALDPSRSIVQYQHTRWGREEGAPSPINDMLQTPDGYLWLATGAGLFRFDGISFERIDTEYNIATVGPPVQLLLARNGDLWISYLLSEKFVIYRGGKLHVVPSPPTNGQVVDFAQTPDGAIWAAIGQFGRPMMRYHEGTWSRVDPTGDGRRSSYDTIVTADGALWASYNHAVYRLPRGAKQFELIISKPGARMRIVLDAAGRVWLTDIDGSQPITEAKGRWTGRLPAFHYPSDNFRRRGKTLFDRDGNLWIARRKDGVERLRTPSALGPSGKAEPPLEFRAADGLTSDTTHKIFEDREGNIWVGTALGLDRFRNANIARDTRLTWSAAYGDILFADADGAVYIGQRDTVYRVPPGGAPHPILSGINEPEAICAGPDRSIWIVLNDKIVVLQQGHRRTVSLPKGLEDGIYDCGLDRAGNFWMTAGGSGLFRLTASGWAHLPAQLPNQFYPTQMVHDKSGNLWLMWGVGTVARLDAQKPRLFNVERKNILGVLRTITPALDGILLGYDRGIARVGERGFSFATVAQIPVLTRSTGLIETGAGETWVFGELGVSRIMTADMVRAFSDRSVRVPARTFGFLDGLPDLRARARNRGLVRGGDGRLWASTDAGTVWLDPARLSFNTVAPQVTIASITANGQRILDPVSIRLPAGASQITIGFAALSLAMPERVRVRYKLEGQDAGWINPGTRRQAFYTNLAPGKYRFRVIAANEDGVWNNRGATLDFTVLPTFVQSIWFKLLVAILVLAALAALYALRLRVLTTRMRTQFDIRMKERERIARELHDTLLQGVHGLVLRFQAVVERLPPSESLRRLLNDALNQADEVLAEGRERVRGLRVQPPVADIAEALMHDASQLAGDNGPHVALTLEGKPLFLDPQTREEVVRIGAEAIRNSISHANASNIAISLHWGARDMTLAIRDDGCGIPDSILTSGGRTGHFGLVGMRERAERIDGRLIVTSREGVGTEVTLTLPVHATYRGRLSSAFDRFRDRWNGRRSS